MEVNDLHANSKCFFDFLRAKRANAAISSLDFNGQILQDGNSIAHACTEHFEKLFAASFSTSDAWFTAIQDSLAYTPQIIDSRTADNCEKFITEEEHFESLPWYGPKVDTGTVFRHLGYPLGINVPIKDKICWVLWNWNLDVWNKFFSHAPVRVSSHTLNILLQSFKQFGSTLKWNGRQRYVGNSFVAMSPYWSFLSTPPLALSLGAGARYFNNKGIDSIAKCYDSKWEILSFPAIRRTYAVGSAYWSKWIQIAIFLQEYQVPLSVDFSDPWCDWLLAKHTRWWTGKANTFYPSLLPSDDITLQCNARWKLQKAPSWWHARFLVLWESSLTFKMKVFMWRIFRGHFTLGAFLSRHGLQGVRCPHCASRDESMRHAFWTCSFIQRDKPVFVSFFETF
ncbi:hypothetical protein KP509_1Z232800 [Ceratopteris richardii]|nr:hypothetical protein KP509_1Z232800 [Ceratopteris richardii]